MSDEERWSGKFIPVDWSVPSSSARAARHKHPDERKPTNLPAESEIEIVDESDFDADSEGPSTCPSTPREQSVDDHPSSSDRPTTKPPSPAPQLKAPETRPTFRIIASDSATRSTPSPVASSSSPTPPRPESPGPPTHRSLPPRLSRNAFSGPKRTSRITKAAKRLSPYPETALRQPSDSPNEPPPSSRASAKSKVRDGEPPWKAAIMLVDLRPSPGTDGQSTSTSPSDANAPPLETSFPIRDASPTPQDPPESSDTPHERDKSTPPEDPPPAPSDPQPSQDVSSSRWSSSGPHGAPAPYFHPQLSTLTAYPPAHQGLSAAYPYPIFQQPAHSYYPPPQYPPPPHPNSYAFAAPYSYPPPSVPAPPHTVVEIETAPRFQDHQHGLYVNVNQQNFGNPRRGSKLKKKNDATAQHNGQQGVTGQSRRGERVDAEPGALKFTIFVPSIALAHQTLQNPDPIQQNSNEEGLLTRVAPQPVGDQAVSFNVWTPETVGPDGKVTKAQKKVSKKKDAPPKSTIPKFPPDPSWPGDFSVQHILTGLKVVIEREKATPPEEKESVVLKTFSEQYPSVKDFDYTKYLMYRDLMGVLEAQMAEGRKGGPLEEGSLQALMQRPRSHQYLKFSEFMKQYVAHVAKEAEKAAFTGGSAQEVSSPDGESDAMDVEMADSAAVAEALMAV